MPVDTICTHNVVTIAADAGVEEAAVEMRRSHVGDLVVTEYRNGREVPIGMLTDRDIVVAVVAAKVDAGSLKVGDIMSRDVATVHKDNGVAFAVAQMRKAGVRRVPVVDSEGGLVGVLSFDDVVQHLAAVARDVADTIRTEQRKEIEQRP